MSNYVSYIITEADKQLMLQRELRYMIKLEVLDSNYKIIDSVEGSVVSGSYNIDSQSDIRRTTSFVILPTKLSSNSPMRLHPFGNIWFDKIVHFYIGVMNTLTEEYTYYSEGYYLYTNTSSNYDAATNQLTVSLNDYMSTLNATRNGQVGTPVIIPAYEFEQNNDGSINITHYNYIRDAMKAVLMDMGRVPIDKLIIDELGATNGLPELQENYLVYQKDYPYWNSVPYDLEFNAGANVLQIVNQLRDLYPNFETFFSPDDNNFVCQLIPSGYNDPVVFDNDFIQSILISEQSAVDLTKVKNVCEVWGKILNPKYYSGDSSTGYENIVTNMDGYYDKLMGNVVNLIQFDFNSLITTYQSQISTTTAEINTKRGSIGDNTSIIATLKAELATLEESSGKPIELLRTGRESLFNDNKASYPNYRFIYDNYLGLMSNSEYDEFVTRLTVISKESDTRRSMDAMTDSEKLWLADLRQALFDSAGNDSKLKVRANNTYDLIVTIIKQAFNGEIVVYAQVSRFQLNEDHVKNYLQNKGYKDKLVCYDDENKVTFIDRLAQVNTADYNAHFGSNADYARSRLAVEIGTYGMQLYSVSVNYYIMYAEYMVISAQKENLELDRTSVDNHRNAVQNEIDNLNNEKYANENAISNVQNKLEKANSDLSTYEEKKSNAKTAAEKALWEDRIQEARTRIAEYNTQIETYMARNVQLDAYIAELKIEKKDLNNQYKDLDSQIKRLENELKSIQDNYLTPYSNTMSVYRNLVETDEAQLEGKYSAIKTKDSSNESIEKEITTLETTLTNTNASLAEVQSKYNTITNYKTTIENAYSLLVAYINAHPESAASESAIANVNTIVDSLSDVFSLYTTDSNLITTTRDSIKENVTEYNNFRILLEGYCTNTTGADIFTYKINLDNYTQYKSGESIAFKVNVKNQSESCYLQINTLPIIPIYQAKSLKDEAAINHFIEKNTLKVGVTYVFMISNITTTKTNRITGEEETVETLFAFLQGTYQLHGIDVLTDGRELTEPYYIMKQALSSTGDDDWSQKKAQIANHTDSTTLINDGIQYNQETGGLDMKQVFDEDGNPVMVYSRKYFELKYNCQNIHFTYVPDSPYTVERLGEILDVKQEDRYKNCDTDLEIIENAKYENWKNSRITDTITITTFLCPFFDVNLKVTYKPRVIQINNMISDEPSDDEPYEYLIKSVSHNLDGLTSTVTMYRYYPLFEPDNDYPTEIR